MENNRKIILYTSIFFYSFLIPIIIIFLNGFRDYKYSKIQYNDLIYKEFTVENIRKNIDSEVGNTYYILVYEDEKTIKINNLLTKSDVNKQLNSLQIGDKISCYLIEDAKIYNLVEMKKGNNYILSLERYSEIYRDNGIGIMVYMPILFLVSAVLATKFLISYKRDKNIIKK